MEVRRLWPGWMVAMVGRDTAGGSDTTIPAGLPFTKIKLSIGRFVLLLSIIIYLLR